MSTNLDLPYSSFEVDKKLTKTHRFDPLQRLLLSITCTQFLKLIKLIQMSFDPLQQLTTVVA